MDLHLAGKTVVVTGASKGIGLAVTSASASEDCHVVADLALALPNSNRWRPREM